MPWPAASGASFSGAPGGKKKGRGASAGAAAAVRGAASAPNSFSKAAAPSGSAPRRGVPASFGPAAAFAAAAAGSRGVPHPGGAQGAAEAARSKVLLGVGRGAEGGRAGSQHASADGAAVGAAQQAAAEAPPKKGRWGKVGRMAKLAARAKLQSEENQSSALDDVLDVARGAEEDQALVGATRAHVFESAMDERVLEFNRRRDALEASMRERHAEQYRSLQRHFQETQENLVTTSPAVMALRRKQAALVQSKNYTEAFEHMKQIKRAEREATASHKAATQRENEMALQRLLEQQRRERETFHNKVGTEQAKLATFRRERLQQLEGSRGAQHTLQAIAAAAKGGQQQGARMESAAPVLHPEPSLIVEGGNFETPYPPRQAQQQQVGGTTQQQDSQAFAPPSAATVSAVSAMFRGAEQSRAALQSQQQSAPLTGLGSISAASVAQAHTIPVAYRYPYSPGLVASAHSPAQQQVGSVPPPRSAAALPAAPPLWSFSAASGGAGGLPPAPPGVLSGAMAAWARGQPVSASATPTPMPRSTGVSPFPGASAVPVAWQPNAALQRAQPEQSGPMQAVAGALATAAQLLAGGAAVPGLAASAFKGLESTATVPGSAVTAEPPAPIFWRNAESAAKAAVAEAGTAPPERQYKLRFTGRAFHEVDHAALTEGLVGTFAALFRVSAACVRVALSAGSVLASVRLSNVPGSIVVACADVQGALEASPAAAVSELAALGLRVAEVYMPPSKTSTPQRAATAHPADAGARMTGDPAMDGSRPHSGDGASGATPAAAAARGDASAPATTPEEGPEDDIDDDDIWDEDMVPLSARAAPQPEKQRLASLDLTQVAATRVKSTSLSKAKLAQQEEAKKRFAGAAGAAQKMSAASRLLGSRGSRRAKTVFIGAGSSPLAEQAPALEAPSKADPAHALALRDKFKSHASTLKQRSRASSLVQKLKAGAATADNHDPTAQAAQAEAEAAQAIAEAAQAEATAAKAKAEAVALQSKALALASGSATPSSVAGGELVPVSEERALVPGMSRSSSRSSSKASSPGHIKPERKLVTNNLDEVQMAKIAKNRAKAKASALEKSKSFSASDIKLLFSYSRHNKYHQLKDLLEGGAPCEPKDKFGNTPLIIACQNGNARCVKVLIRYGADMDRQNKQGNTGLHYCVAYGFNALGDLLVAKGASDKVTNLEGLTPYEGIK